eukprot:Rmarinus@m.16425
MMAGNFGSFNPSSNMGGAGGTTSATDELYEGYNDLDDDFDTNFATNQYVPPTASYGGAGRAAPGTSFGAPPSRFGVPMQSRMGRVPGSRMGTGMRMPGEDRPMTSVAGKGYTSHGSKPTRGQNFDPLQQGPGKGPAPPLVKKTDLGPEEQAKEMEKQVNRLIEESAQANLEGSHRLALDKARSAYKLERKATKLREGAGLLEQVDSDLAHAVLFNMAAMFHAAGHHTEALNTYTAIVRNKQWQSGRLRVNMGNIYYEQKKYPIAIKMYRMALDQVQNTCKELRAKIHRNIGNASVKLSQYQEAQISYEAVMDSVPDYQTGFNLLLCYFTRGDQANMKRCFTRLLGIRVFGTELEDEDDVDGTDDLRTELKDRQKQLEEYISMAARLLVPHVEDTWEQGYRYVVECLQAEGYSVLAAELEISLAMSQLRDKKVSDAVRQLKEFEGRDETVIATKAATNLSFIHFLEEDIPEATRYATIARTKDKYNAKAMVNLGNVRFYEGNFDEAKELYTEAQEVEADCIEATYNLGLCCKRLTNYDEALKVFQRLHNIIPTSTEVMFQIADLQEKKEEYREAIRWLEFLNTRVKTDAGVLSRLGNLYQREDDETQAYHFHQEAYKCYPVNMDVIAWLGAYYVKNEMYEKAIQYFDRASVIQAREIKWKLMVASCHRRIGAYQQALAVYEDAHNQDPENVECLRYLEGICNDLGMVDQAREYKKLRLKAEREQENKQAMRKQGQTFADGLPGMGGVGGGGVRQDALTTHAAPTQYNMEVVGRVETPEMKRVAHARKMEDDDDWGNETLDDNLLPM